MGKVLKKYEYDAMIETNQVRNPAEPVKVDLYYESLCPGCRYFFETQLYPAFYKFRGLGVLNVGLFPYGNAKEEQKSDGSWKFTCQHGKKECTGNIIEACIMSYLDNDSDKYIPVINCMEGSENPIKSSRGCLAALADMNKSTINKIHKCAKGKEGNSLMHQIGLATESLQPAHKYVPWIVVNGVHNDTLQKQAQTDLTSLVCNLFQGSKPYVCSF